MTRLVTASASKMTVVRIKRRLRRTAELRPRGRLAFGALIVSSLVVHRMHHRSEVR
jgi:hypothetical protein